MGSTVTAYAVAKSYGQYPPPRNRKTGVSYPTRSGHQAHAKPDQKEKSQGNPDK